MTLQLNYRFNPEAEASLLGSIMLNSDIGMFECERQGLTEESFNDRRNGKIYKIMRALANEGRPIDPIMICEKVKEGSGIDAMLLSGYLESAATIGHIVEHIEIVLKKEQVRKIENACTMALSDCRDGREPHEISGELMADIANDAQTLNVLTLADMRKNKIDQWHKAVDVGFVGLPSVFQYVNQYTGGSRKGIHEVLGGFRGEGKSTLLRQDALSLADGSSAGRKVPVALFSMEDPADIAASMIVGNSGDFSVFQHDIGHGTQDSIKHADESWLKIADIPLYIVGNPMNINQLCASATALRARYGIEKFYLDHLQYLLPSSQRFGSRNDEVMHNSRQICAVIKKLDVAWTSASQFSRGPEKQQRKPRLSDLRDSGAIEQDSKLVFLLYYDAKMEIHVLEIAKQNFGPSPIEITMRRRGNRQRFDEIGVVDNSTTDEQDEMEELV